MGDATLSGYKAAAAAITWASGNDLNALPDTEWTDLSDEIDNSTNLYILVDLYINLGTAVFAGTDSIFEIYLIPEVKSGSYPTWTGGGTDDEQENSQFFVAAVTTTGTSAVQAMATRGITLPNGKYKWGFRNNTGVALNATNVVYWRPHQFTAA